MLPCHRHQCRRRCHTCATPHCTSYLQVRKISVKQVVSPIIFDNMKTAVKGGLYDPAFGPMDPKER